LPDQTVFKLLRHKNFAFSFQTLWTILWLTMTSHRPISLTAWLEVKPNFLNL